MSRRPRPRPEPPRPNLVRRPSRAFGWLDAALLHEGWLARLGAEAVAVLVLLALAADQRGASYYGRARMAERLGLKRQSLDLALARLLELRLVAHRPWRAGCADGVWQLLPMSPGPAKTPGGADCESVSAILARLGFGR